MKSIKLLKSDEPTGSNKTKIIFKTDSIDTKLRWYTQISPNFSSVCMQRNSNDQRSEFIDSEL